MTAPLSHPVSVTDEYLAAILAELQALRAALEPPAVVMPLTSVGRGRVVDEAPAKRPRRRQTPGD